VRSKEFATIEKGRDDTVEFLLGNVVETPRDRRPGVVDKHVDATEPAFDIGDH